MAEIREHGEGGKGSETVGRRTYFINSGSIGLHIVDADVKAIFSETNGYGLASVTRSVSQASALWKVFDGRTYMPREEPVTMTVRFP